MAFNLANEVKRALVRRIVYVLVACALAWFGIGRAHAREGGSLQCTVKATTTCHSRQEALDYAKLESTATKVCVSRGHTDPAGYSDWKAQYKSHEVFNPGTSGEYISVAYDDKSPSGSYVGCSSVQFYYTPKDCSVEQPLGQSSWQNVNESFMTFCKESCVYKGSGSCIGTVIDGEDNYTCANWTPTGDMCSSVGGADGVSSPSDSDGDGTSDGNDSSPNNPGKGGSGKGGPTGEDGGGNPNGGAGSGPNGGQGNGSGEGSGNGNTSGGGGSCNSPPSSTGDAILAQIAYQTWATRCAVEKGNSDGKGKGNGQGDGNGDGQGNGDGDGTDFGQSNPPEAEDFDPSEHRKFGLVVDASMLDSEPIFGGGSCPVFSVTVYGKSFSTAELPGWCDLLLVMRALIRIFGAFTALRILMGNNS